MHLQINQNILDFQHVQYAHPRALYACLTVAYSRAWPCCQSARAHSLLQYTYLLQPEQQYTVSAARTCKRAGSIIRYRTSDEQ